MEKQNSPLNKIEQDLDAEDKQDWIEVWAINGLKQMAAYLKKHADFEDFIDKNDSSEETEQLVSE